MKSFSVECDSTLFDKMGDFRIPDEELYMFSGLKRENIIEWQDYLLLFTYYYFEKYRFL